MKSILCQIYLKFFNFFNSLVGKTFSSLNHIYLSYLLGKTSTKSNFYHEHPNFLFMLPRVLPKILIKSYLLSFYHQKSYFADTLVSVKNGHFSLHSCKTIKTAVKQALYKMAWMCLFKFPRSVRLILRLLPYKIRTSPYLLPSPLHKLPLTSVHILPSYQLTMCQITSWPIWNTSHLSFFIQPEIRYDDPII